MSFAQHMRKIPPVCALNTIGNAVVGRLHFHDDDVDRTVVMDDGQVFRVFRRLTLDITAPPTESPGAVFIVRFRFARLSQKTNRIASLLPIPAIAGYPGFREKIWAVNDETGYWQGMYQFTSTEAVEAYRNSFVLGVMTKRAIPDSMSHVVLPETRLSEYIEKRQASR